MMMKTESCLIDYTSHVIIQSHQFTKTNQKTCRVKKFLLEFLILDNGFKFEDSPIEASPTVFSTKQISPEIKVST